MRPGLPFIALLLLAACHKGSHGPCNGSPCGPIDVSMITARDNNSTLMGTVDLDDWRGDVTFTSCEEALFPAVNSVDLDTGHTMYCFPNPTEGVVALSIGIGAPGMMDVVLVDECLVIKGSWQFMSDDVLFDQLDLGQVPDLSAASNYRIYYQTTDSQNVARLRGYGDIRYQP